MLESGVNIKIRAWSGISETNATAGDVRGTKLTVGIVEIARGRAQLALSERVDGT